MSWRPMQGEDLDAVQILADAIHLNHPEDRSVFVERLQLYPQGCLVLQDDERLLGYAITHPWRMGEPPPLNSVLRQIPDRPTTYYIHDVALLPEGRGKGYAGQAVDRLAEHAKEAGFVNMSLVAVNGSQAFWERLGFCSAAVPGLEAKLLSYGPDASLMVRDLTGSCS